MRRKIVRFQAATLFLIFVSLICWKWHQADSYPDYDKQAEQEIRNYVDNNNTWAIGYENAIRKGSYSTPDATGDLLYLPYNSSNCVNVYDHSGKFLYAIHFPYRQNGTISVRCSGNLALISNKDNITYVFEGNELVEQFDLDTARSRGYSELWFQQKKEFQSYEGDILSISDHNGNRLYSIQMPEFTPAPNPIRLILFLLALAIYIAALIPAAIEHFSAKANPSPSK